MNYVIAFIGAAVGMWALTYGFLMGVVFSKGAKDTTIGGIISGLGAAILFLSFMAGQ